LSCVSLFFFYLYVDHQYLHSFPTRRSSDLLLLEHFQLVDAEDGIIAQLFLDAEKLVVFRDPVRAAHRAGLDLAAVGRDGEVGDRSEEHTSELQSQSNLVCRLLLEKKKKKI